MPTLRTKLQIVCVAVSLFLCLITGSAFALTNLSISSAAASSYHRSHTAYKAIDKRFSTYWRGGFFKSRWWLKLDLGKKRSLSRISIYWHKYHGSGRYNIQASNNGRTWVNLYTNLSSKKGGRGNLRLKSYNLKGSYRYIRIYLNRAQRFYPIIYEVRIYGPTESDTTAPTGSIKINNNAQYANSTAVTLKLSAKDNSGGSGLSQMKFSNNRSRWSTAESYATTKKWTLLSGNGTRTVYVRYKDKSGNWSGIYSDSITLDTTSPTGSIKVNNNAAYTNTTSVTLNLSASDSKSGVSQMKFSNNNSTWSTAEAYATTKSWTLSSSNGTRTVYVKYKDGAGNWSGAYSDTIVLDTRSPSGSVSINSGDASTSSCDVTLTLSASDSGSGMGQGAQMQFSNNNSTWSTPETYASTRVWTLPSGDGEKTVYVKFKDVSGNWSSVFSDTITLSTIVTSNISYSYDDLNRLENITVEGMSTTYTYDEVGNIKNETTQ